MLRNQIQDQIKQAMKSKEAVRLETLRFLWSEIGNAEIDKKAPLSDGEVVALMQKEVKKRNEAMGKMKQVGRDELVEEEEAKLVIIKDFLPEQMNREELERVVEEVVSGGVSDFGAVMGGVMAKVIGKADGAMVRQIVERQLGKKSER